MIGFDKESISEWHEKYFQVFRDYIDRGMFVGKDQNLMSTVCLETNMCLFIRSQGDWYQLRNYFSKLNPSLKYERFLKMEY